jgi:hypothetical protein
VLLGCLTSCKAADMRAKAAMHLDACVQLHGACLVSLPACERLRLVGCSGIVSTWQVHCVWRNEETAAGPSLPPVFPQPCQPTCSTFPDVAGICCCGAGEAVSCSGASAAACRRWAAR